MENKKPILAILTESIRRDLEEPLKYFKKLEVVHFYKKAPYGDLTKEELKKAKKYENFFDLWKKLKKTKPEIIQGAEPYGSREAFKLSLLTYLFSKIYKIPYVFPVLENRPVYEKFGPFLGFLMNKFLGLYGKNAKAIFYLNKGAKENLQKPKIKENKLFYLLWGLWGVDTSLFFPNPKIKTKRPTILFAGRLDKAKGIKYLLSTFLIVKEKIKNVKLILIGKGEEEEFIEKFIKENHFENEIIKKKALFQKELPFYFQKATLTCYPSITLKHWEEQVGMVLLQSLSCGTPVVSTKSGAIPEYIKEDFGILVKEKNSEALSKAILKLLRNPKLREKMGEKGRKYIIENFQSKNIVKKGEKIIMSLFP